MEMFSMHRSSSSPAIIDDSAPSPYTAASAAPAVPSASPAIALAVYDELAAVEAEWRRFERIADCTVFQAFDWLATWHRHIGRRGGERPAVVVGRGAGDETLILLPLAVWPGMVRRLTWLGSELCDYNAPLLAPGFCDRLAPEEVRRLWRDIRALLNGRPELRHDVVELTKMPDMVGAQRNPLLALGVGLNPSGAHVMDLNATWDELYNAKRSSATRRHDRSKRKRLAEMGEVNFVTPAEPQEIARTLHILIAQKTKAFARMGIGNMFAREGYRDFFLELATHPHTRHLAHVSRLDVGATPAAVNFGLTFRGCYYHVLASYDDGEVARHGPGAAHLRDIFGHAIATGYRYFDFTIGDEAYKREWADREVALHDHVAAATLRGAPAAALIVARRRLKRLIKQNQALWALFTRLRSALGARSKAAAGRDTPPSDRGGKSPSIVPE
jgi:CelD/BcsL family acetyltransferase involved in cellulose biosynthesis